MDVWAWLWIAWGAMFAGVEGTALFVGRGTLTSKVMWLITGAGPWHIVARVALIVLLGWLPLHFRLPFTDWQSVWPNIVASALCAATAVPAMVRWFKAHQAKHHEALKAHIEATTAEHHERLLERLKSDLGLGQ